MDDCPSYAFLIYDKRKNCFRLTPVQDHIHFEKVIPGQTKELQKAPTAKVGAKKQSANMNKMKDLRVLAKQRLEGV